MTKKEIEQNAQEMVDYMLEDIDENLTEDFLNRMELGDKPMDNAVKIKKEFWRLLGKEASKLGK